MPWTKGIATDYEDLVTKIALWASDAAVHGADAWEVMRSDPYPAGTILKGFGWRDGEHFYAGLMPRDIVKGKTYVEWLMKWSTIAKYFMGYDTPFSVNGTTISFPGGSMSFSEPEIFLKSAKVLFFNTFKQYSDGLDWFEQPGGYQPLKPALMPLLVTMSGSDGLGTAEAPLPPDIGFPAFGMDSDGPKDGRLQYWITKDRYRMIIVSLNCDVWEVAYLGFIEPYQAKFQYAWPAAAVGATTGAIKQGKSVHLHGAQDPSPVTGVMFDYTGSNWSLGRSLPTMAGMTDGTDHDLSQVILTLPDGRHAGFANFIQGVEVIPEIQNGKVVAYYFPQSFPARPGVQGNLIRPTCSDVSGTTHMYGTGEKTQYQLEPLELLEAIDERVNFFGRLERFYWPSIPIDHIGEITIDGKLHLAVPNGWADRDFWIHHGCDKVWQYEELLAMQQKIKSMNKQANCLIRLED